jgi:hypothetical protein
MLVAGNTFYPKFLLIRTAESDDCSTAAGYLSMLLGNIHIYIIKVTYLFIILHPLSGDAVQLFSGKTINHRIKTTKFNKNHANI